MELYYGRMSGNSARVALALAEAKAQYTPHLLDTQRGENRAPEYLGINPMGKIPALRDGALRLWESNAINWYVAEKLPQAGLLPRSLEERVSVQRWLFFQTGHVSPACVPLFRATNARVQEFWKTTGDPQAAEAARKELARYLPVLEEALQGREWLEGAFSLADVAYVPHLALIEEGGFDFSPWPRVRDWLSRLVARPAWQSVTRMIFT
jgi:glutathione S-transferase